MILIPLFIWVIIFYGFFKKVPIYDTFIEGAKESFEMILTIFPPMLGMVLGVNLLLKSGALSFLFSSEILPMAFLRSVSGSTTLALMNHIFEIHGPDSFIGRLASVIQGSSDTTIYVLTVYFGSVGIVKTRYALKVGLVSDFVAILSSILVVWLFFGR